MRALDGHARSKWGKALDGTGFQIVPNLLLTQQGNLGLSTTDIVVLLHLNRYWWTRDQHPYPSPTRIAGQMGLHPRSVERCLKRLAAKGAIRRLAPHQTPSGRTVRPVSLLPLAESLTRIAEHWNEAPQAPKPHRNDAEATETATPEPPSPTTKSM